MENQGLIRRTKRNQNFTVIGNDVIQDSRMSIDARGVLIYILSLPDDWVIYKKDLQERINVGRRILDRCFSEMKEAGYLIESGEIKEDGRFVGKGYSIFDFSVYDQRPEMYTTDVQNVQRTDVQNVHSTDVQNVHLLNTNIQRTNKGNFEKKKSFQKPTVEEVTAYAKIKHSMSDHQAKTFAEYFWNFYESKGWLVGKSAMKNWESAVTGTWKKKADEVKTSVQAVSSLGSGVKFNLG